MMNLYEFYNKPVQLPHYDTYGESLQRIIECSAQGRYGWEVKDNTAILHIIMRSPYYAYIYALRVIKGRFYDAEPYLVKTTGMAVYYARNVMEKRWPEAEPYIMGDKEWWDFYRKQFRLDND